MSSFLLQSKYPKGISYKTNDHAFRELSSVSILKSSHQIYSEYCITYTHVHTEYILTGSFWKTSMKLELKKVNNDCKIQCYEVDFKYTIKYFDVCQSSAKFLYPITQMLEVFSSQHTLIYHYRIKGYIFSLL